LESNVASRECGLYTPGHEVHWIQGLRSGNDRISTPSPAHLIGVAADGEVVVEVEGTVGRFWNHEPARIAFLARGVEDRLEVNWRWSTLKVPNDHGFFLFYVADLTDHLVCPETPPHGTPEELLTQAGGFTLSGPAALAQLSSGSERRSRCAR
jgi:hypothetical protein